MLSHWASQNTSLSDMDMQKAWCCQTCCNAYLVLLCC
jgi:hypothetical protein